MQETQFDLLSQEDPLEEENGTPLQDSCLKNPKHREACCPNSPKCRKESTWLNDYARMHMCETDNF